MKNSKRHVHHRKNKTVKEGWAIVRVSTLERGRTQHGSLEAQETMIRRWEKGIFQETGVKYNIVKVVEEKTSGKRENTHRRRDLMRLVQLIELGAIDFIVVEKLDRLSRDEIFNLELMNKVLEYGVELYFVEGGKIDFRNQGDRWRFKIDNIRAGEYSADLSEKVSRKKRIAMVEAGKDPTPYPLLGLDKHPDWKGKYVLNHEELKIVVDIMEKFRDLGGSRQGILKYCRDKDYKTKSWWSEKRVDENGKIIKPRLVGGKEFNWDTLMNLLTSPKYRGFNSFYDSFDQYPDMQDENGYVVWEYHHHRENGDFISPELLKSVDDLAQKQEYQSRETEFLLSGILRAPDGSRYGGEYTKKKAYYYNRKAGKRFGYKHLHRLVMNRLKEYLKESGLLEKLIQRMEEHKDFGLPKIRQQKEFLESEIQRLHSVTDNFSEAIREAAAEGSQNLADVVKTLIQQKENSEQEILKLRSELADLKTEEENFRRSFKGDQLKSYLNLVMKHFDQLHTLEQKRVLRTLIPEAIIHTGKTENTLELHLNLAPEVTPFPSGRGRTQDSTRKGPATIYQFPAIQKSVDKTGGASRNSGHKKSHFSSSAALSGTGEEKWPFVRNGRADWI